MSIPLPPFEDIPESDTFSDFESQGVIQNYVCGVCWSDLYVLYIPGSHRRLIVCEEHGSVCRAGRVTKNTVSINYEKASRRYRDVIQNVDEWKCLIEPKKPINQLIKELGF